MITETIFIGDSIKLNWHGFHDWLRVLYIWGDSIIAVDRLGKPFSLNRSNISERNVNACTEKGFFLVSHLYPEAVKDDQIILSGYFNGAFWILSGKDEPVSFQEFELNYQVIRPFTTQNIMRVFDKMLVMLPCGDVNNVGGDEATGD